jgi:hypothetical protein
VTAYIFLGAVILAFAAGGTASWNVQAWRYKAKEAEAIEIAAENAKFNRQSANKASTSFEVKRAQNEERIRTIEVEVEKIVDRPVYVTSCIDPDGLRILNEEINRTKPNSGQPSLTLPKASEPKRFNWRRDN